MKLPAVVCCVCLSMTTLAACGATTAEPQGAGAASTATTSAATTAATAAPEAATATATVTPAASATASAIPAATAAPVTTAPATAAAPATTAAATPATRLGEGATEILLSVSMSRMTVEQDKSKVLYEQDRGRQTNHYRTCEFDYKEFMAAVGKDNLDKNLTLKVSVGASRIQGSKAPLPKGSPQPLGGFTYEFFTCKVAKLVSAKSDPAP